jgi:hypothetical protein
VQTPEDAVGGLIDLVRGFDRPKGNELSFLSKLEAVLAALQAGDTATACASLDSFIQEAVAQSGRKLTSDQADEMIGEAAIQQLIGCV